MDSARIEAISEAIHGIRAKGVFAEKEAWTKHKAEANSFLSE